MIHIELQTQKMKDLVLLIAIIALSTKALGSNIYFPQLTKPYPRLLDNSPPGTLYWDFNVTYLGVHPITYSLENNAIQDWLQINSSNGITTVKKRIDREAINDIGLTRFFVYATGSGNEQANQRVILQIDDVNNKPPIMTNLPRTINITEDTPVGNVIYTVKYEDKDDQLNTQTEITITYGNEGGAFRMVNNIVYVNKSLDYDNGKRKYVLNITANNTQAPHPWTRSVLTINVLNSDDLGLNFTQTSYQAEGIKSSVVGTPIVTVTAYDLDNLNEKIEYGIFPDSNKGDLYKIDTRTGQITVNGALELGTHTLVVTATSKKHGLVIALLTVKVISIRTIPFVTSVQEDQPDAILMDLTVVESRFNVTDASFVIQSGNDENLFAINSDQLKVGSVALDRETQSTYLVVIKVTKNITVIGLASVTIRVEDINDNSPQFEQASFLATIKEDLSVGKDIVMVKAVDPDYGLNGTVYYMITTQQDLFQIDNSTGQVSLSKSLDHEKASSHVITVQASDGGSPPKTNSTNVTITVQDANDNSPVISSYVMKITVLENVKVGFPVATIAAKDADKGKNANITYSIKEGAQGHFIIDSNTGVITTSAQLSSKQISSYSIVVMAKDHGNVPRSTLVFVSVSIDAVQENNHRPIFKKNMYIGGVYENTCCNQKILTVSAEDGDSGSNGEVQYDIISAGNSFFVDPTSGELTTTGSFDKEEGKKYEIIVQARDKASSSKVSDPNARVAVVVLRESYSVAITAGVRYDYLLKRKQEFKSVLDELIDAEAYIKDVRSGNAENTTLVLFNAIDDKNIDDLQEKDYDSIARTLGSEEKQNLINGKYQKWRIQYGRPTTSARRTAVEGGMSGVVGAMICLAIMIGVGGIIMIVILIKKKRERQRVRKAARVTFNDKPQFIDPVSRSARGIENAQEAQEVIVHMDEEMSSEASDEMEIPPLNYVNEGYHPNMSDDDDAEGEDNFCTAGENINFSTFLPPPPSQPPPAVPNSEIIDVKQESQEERMTSDNDDENCEELEQIGAVLPPQGFADHINVYDDTQHYSESPTHSVTDSTTNLVDPSSYKNSLLNDPQFGFAGGLRASINENISTEL